MSFIALSDFAEGTIRFIRIIIFMVVAGVGSWIWSFLEKRLPQWIIETLRWIFTPVMAAIALIFTPWVLVWDFIWPVASWPAMVFAAAYTAPRKHFIVGCITLALAILLAVGIAYESWKDSETTILIADVIGIGLAIWSVFYFRREESR